MATTTFFAFTPNGYLYNSPVKRSHSTLPDPVSQRLENTEPKIAEVYHAAFADDGAFFVTYRAAEAGKYDFVGVEHRGLSASLIQWLGQYPNYKRDIPSVRVVFGPYGQYFAWDKNGHHPGAVLPAVASSLQQDGGPVANPPRVFALGPGGSYLIVKQGGEYYYDLVACSAEADQYFDRICELAWYPQGRPRALDDLISFSLSNTKPGHWFSIWKNGTIVSAVSADWHNMLAPTTTAVKEYLQTVSSQPSYATPVPLKPSAQVTTAEIRPSPVSAISNSSLQNTSPSLYAPQPVHAQQVPVQPSMQQTPPIQTQSPHQQIIQTPSPHSQGVAEMQASQPVHQLLGSPGAAVTPSATPQPQVPTTQQPQPQIVQAPQTQDTQGHPQRPQSVAVQRPPLQTQQTQPISSTPAPQPAHTQGIQAYPQRPQSVAVQRPPLQTQQSQQTPSTPATQTHASPPQSPGLGHHAHTPSISGASISSQPQLQQQVVQQGTTPLQQSAQRPSVPHAQSTPSIAPSTQSAETTMTTTSTGSGGKTGAKLKKMFKGIGKAGKDLYHAQMQNGQGSSHGHQHHQHHHHGHHNQQQQHAQNTSVQQVQNNVQQVQNNNVQQVQVVQQAQQQVQGGQPQRIQYVQRIVQTPQGPQVQYVQVQQAGRPSVASQSSQSGQAIQQVASVPATHQPGQAAQQPHQPQNQTLQQAGQAIQVLQQAQQLVQQPQQPQQQQQQQLQQRPPNQTQAGTPYPQVQAPQQPAIQLQQQIVQNASPAPQAANQPGGRVSKLGIEPTININPSFNFGGGKEERGGGGGGGGGNGSGGGQRPQQHQQPYYQEQPYYAQQQPVIYQQQPVIYESQPGQTIIVENGQPGEVVVMESGAGGGYGETVVVEQGTGYSDTMVLQQAPGGVQDYGVADGGGGTYVTGTGTEQTDVMGVTSGVQAMGVSDPQGQAVQYAYADPTMAVSGAGTEQVMVQDPAAYGMSDGTTVMTTDPNGIAYDYTMTTEQVTTDQYGNTDVQYQQTEIIGDNYGNTYVEQDTVDVQQDACGDVSYEETDVSFMDDGGGGFCDDW